MSKALLVIDVQESFRHTPYWREDELDTYLAAQNRLIEGARAAGIQVVRVFHVQHDGGPFSKDLPYVAPLDGSAPHADLRVEKHAHSALVGTDLARRFRERGIDGLIVSGIRTEQCCETTTRHASDLGFSVEYVTEATLTFPMVHASGRIFTPAEIRERTELVLAGRFATICTVDDVLSRLSVPA